MERLWYRSEWDYPFGCVSCLLDVILLCDLRILLSFHSIVQCHSRTTELSSNVFLSKCFRYVSVLKGKVTSEILAEP